MALKLIAEKNGGLHKDNMVSLEDALKDREDNDGEDGGEESNAPDIDSQVSSSTGTKLIDDRFSSLFEDEDFAIDETSDTFRLSNPSGKCCGVVVVVVVVEENVLFLCECVCLANSLFSVFLFHRHYCA